MQVLAADAAGGNLDSNLARPRLPISEIGEFQKIPNLLSLAPSPA
jgi:hypothetical protein